MSVRRRVCFVAALIFSIATGSALAEPVVIAASTPYHDDADIQQSVRLECTELNTQLANFIQEFARAKGVEVTFGDVNASTGRTLRLSITSAISQGNAFLGHHKSSSARGTLYQDGSPIAAFRARRNSMGGAFAGYKGSCAVLGRTVRAMGEDIAAWLTNPVDGVQLGDR